MYRIETRQIKSISGFVSCIEQNINSITANNDLIHKIYRGQSNRRWGIIPSYFRSVTVVTGLSIAEENTINKLSDYSVGLTKDYVPNDSLEWMILGQHHGLHTRLTDWSFNPLVALYFACESKQHDGAVFQLTVKNVNYGSQIPRSAADMLSSDRPEYIEPKHVSKRITSQRGCFILVPQAKRSIRSLESYYRREEMLESGFSDMIKYIIPERKKITFKQELNELGINYFTIYPDLDGLTRYLNNED